MTTRQATTLRLHRTTGRDVLAGRLAGEHDRGKIERQLQDTEVGSTVLLDFEGVQFLTSSYFMAALWSVFWAESSAGLRRDLYPLILATEPDIREEMEIALKANGEPALFVESIGGERQIREVGLETTGSETLEHVKRLGAATASDLFKAYDGKVGKTAWNNRLALLNRQRILRRRKEGRQYLYWPSWKELGHGD